MSLASRITQAASGRITTQHVMNTIVRLLQRMVLVVAVAFGPRGAEATNIVNFAGFQVSALGVATLSGGPDHLTVDQLTASGQDGFSVAVGNLDSVTLSMSADITRNTTSIVTRALWRLTPDPAGSVAGVIGGANPQVYAD